MQRLGARIVSAERGTLANAVTVTGSIEFDERTSPSSRLAAPASFNVFMHARPVTWCPLERHWPTSWFLNGQVRKPSTRRFGVPGMPPDTGRTPTHDASRYDRFDRRANDDPYADRRGHQDAERATGHDLAQGQTSLR